MQYSSLTLMNRRHWGIKLLIVILIAFSGTYIGIFAYAMYDYNGVGRNLQQPDPSKFVEADYDKLYSMALWYESNIYKNHMPQDMIVNTIYNCTSEKSIPVGYHVSYDSAEWSGNYLVAESARYVVHCEEGRDIYAEYALGNITRVLRGIDKILHVSPNGGMARYAWKLEEYWYDITNLRGVE